MGYRTLLLFIFICVCYPATTVAEATLKAAFVRDHQLWIKEGNKETQLTANRYVTSPKWSMDGRFLAFLDGDAQDKKVDLYIYDSEEKEIYQPYPSMETREFYWSPVSNHLAYRIGGLLNVTKMKNGRPEGFSNVALGVSHFNWFPDGKAFIVSSQSHLLPTGWGPVHLFKVPSDADLDTTKIIPFHTIKTNSTNLFAIDAEYFKWSANGEWVSFLATPTASWAMDSNTLSVLSSEGNDFQVVGKMLSYKDWIKWSPVANKLAFISGEGRFFVENKNTIIKDIPTWKKESDYTPEGYVDLDLEWFSENSVLVARAKENKEWEEGPVPTMFTKIYEINVDTGDQTQISFPGKNEVDVDPQVIGTTITWYRSNAADIQGTVWLKENVNESAYPWLKNVDFAPIFFNGK